MSDQSLPALDEHRRADWVRLRTLVVLRWIAVAGQLIAIVVAKRLFELELMLGLAYGAVGLAAITNLVALAVWPGTKRLSEREVAGVLLFDLLQLSFLLYLTGGLNNPFALLILVPVTISATALRWATTVALGVVSILAVTAVTLWHVPLQTETGMLMQMPPEFVLGFWLAIVIGAVFLAAFAQRVTSEVHAMSEALLATQLALAREQRLTTLGGVVAAAAHELGTPLATIKLVSAEMMDELDGDMREDARLIRDQADRCRDILRSMGRAGKDDAHLRQAPLDAVLREAAEPHSERGKKIAYDLVPPGPEARQPVIERRPEIIHGLRNLVQNAVDFAETTVWVEASWTEERITVRIADDGPGFPPAVLSRIGDPFVRHRRAEVERGARPGYEGMGLGLFIAKTLLERSGAELSFANGPGWGTPRQGAIVAAIWPRQAISPAAPASGAGLGENRPIES